MSVLECILCDDNPHFTKDLATRLKKLGAEKNWDITVRCFHSPYALLRYTKEPAPKTRQIYFLDIEMPGVTGFQLADYLLHEEIQAPVVFVSARNELVYQSMLYRPFYFMRKTALEQELEPLLTRLHKEYGRELHRVQLNSGKQTYDLIPEKISYVEAARNYALLHTCKEKSALRVRMKITDLEESWRPYGFMRVHKSYLVNRIFIDRLKEQQLLLTTGELVSVGKKWAAEVNRYISEEMG